MSEQPELAAACCAICGKPQDAKVRPFCSKRCADVDLGRWLNGNYVIPGRELEAGIQHKSGGADEDPES